MPRASTQTIPATNQCCLQNNQEKRRAKATEVLVWPDGKDEVIGGETKSWIVSILSKGLARWKRCLRRPSQRRILIHIHSIKRSALKRYSLIARQIQMITIQIAQKSHKAVKIFITSSKNGVCNETACSMKVRSKARICEKRVSIICENYGCYALYRVRTIAISNVPRSPNSSCFTISAPPSRDSAKFQSVSPKIYSLYICCMSATFPVRTIEIRSATS